MIVIVRFTYPKCVTTIKKRKENEEEDNKEFLYVMYLFQRVAITRNMFDSQIYYEASQTENLL